MTDADLYHFATKIIAAVQEAGVYRRANAAIAKERAQQAPDGLMGGLELPCYIQDRIRSALVK